MRQIDTYRKSERAIQRIHTNKS